MLILSPIDPFLLKHGALLLDGGLASELEKMGFDLNTPLWSARLLDSHPDAIRRVHHAYLEAGADCITSASYQASIPGFISQGYSDKSARRLLKRSIDLAVEARDEFVQRSKNSGIDRLRPLVAASIGPYGAYLADGAEFRGNYTVSRSELRAFHEPRWEILRETPANLFACETIPSFEEAEALLDILRQTPEIFAWISFSCKDGERISDGTPICECAALFKECDQVVAVGINCTAPRFISSLIEQVRLSVPNMPVVAYPNSGAIYNSTTRTWTGKSDPLNYGNAACDWHRAGAGLIGGCCQVGPDHIRAMKSALLDHGLYRS